MQAYQEWWETCSCELSHVISVIKERFATDASETELRMSQFNQRCVGMRRQPQSHNNNNVVKVTGKPCEMRRKMKGSEKERENERKIRWEPVWIREKVGMSGWENMYCLQSPAKVIRERKTSCVGVCLCVVVFVCVQTNSWELEWAHSWQTTSC